MFFCTRTFALALFTLASGTADKLFGGEQKPIVQPRPIDDRLIRFESREEPSDPKAGEERSFEIAESVKMVFCYIPAGEVQLGSPKTEAERSSDEDEEARGKYKTKGFWLAKYTVTQKEYEAVIGKNPSYFTPSEVKVKAADITDTSRFPVEMVNRQDAQDFVKEMNKRGGAAKMFGKGTFVLPHEDAWEYAYRGGKGNGQAFYWGNALTGDQANCNYNANYPFGGIGNGTYVGRTTEVGSYAKAAPHPWGLCDMSGNVYQWCDNLYRSERKSRVIRGGSWFNDSRHCRGANRYRLDPDRRSCNVGFRVSLRLD